MEKHVIFQRRLLEAEIHKRRGAGAHGEAFQGVSYYTSALPSS
jgi:hypothetical protein